MLRQSLIYLLLSVLVVVFAKYIHVLIVYVVMCYTWVMVTVGPLFNQGNVDGMTRKIIVLVLIPVLIVAIPALIYRLVRGKNMPWLTELTWGMWLIIVLSNLVIH